MAPIKFACMTVPQLNPRPRSGDFVEEVPELEVIVTYLD